MFHSDPGGAGVAAPKTPFVDSSPLMMLAAGGLVTLAYVVAATIGFQLSFVAEQVTTVWAPSGIAIAALLLAGPKLWPFVWMGAFAANAGTDAPLWTAPIIASGNTLEAVAAAWLLTRARVAFDPQFRRVSDVMSMVGLAALLCTVISATVGVVALCAAGVQPWERFGVLWLDWWLGDTLGAIIVAPAILTAATMAWTRVIAARAAAAVTAAAAASYVVFAQDVGPGTHPLAFVVFPIVIAAASLGGPAVSALVVLATSAAAVAAASAGLAAMPAAEAHQGLVVLQIFMGVLGATALLLAAAMTERRTAEQHARDTARVLNERDEMLRLAQRAGGVAVFEWDFRNHVARCSAEFFRIFGLPARDGEMAGSQWAEFVHPDDRNRMAAHLAAALQGSEPATADYRIQTRDGEIRWLTYTGKVERTADGDRMLGTVLEITDRKRTEAALEQEIEIRTTLARVGASLASELHSDALVQAVTDAATQLTEAEFGAFFYNVTDNNGESYQLYTLSGAAREAFAKFPNPRATAIFGPTFRGEGNIRLDDVTRDPRYGRQGPHHGMPPGHLPVRSYLAIPVVGAGGAVLGGLFFGHSQVARFTERHELLATGVAGWAAIALDNARLYRSAEEASRLKDEFLATLSHELRTPINAVLGWTRMLRQGALTESSPEHALEAIERNAHAQAQLVEDLLDMSRIVTGRLSIGADAVNLGTVVDEAVETVRAGVSAKGLTLRVEQPEQRVIVTGDAGRLQQTVWNLVANAIKFTPAGGSVDVALRQAGAGAEIVVRDTGQGFDPSFRPYLFQRFSQLDSSKARQHGGLGLGLSIVRHLVEAHGGSVRAESDGAGRGATFAVTLPLRAAGQSTAQLSSEA